MHLTLSAVKKLSALNLSAHACGELEWIQVNLSGNLGIHNRNSDLSSELLKTLSALKLTALNLSALLNLIALKYTQLECMWSLEIHNRNPDATTLMVYGYRQFKQMS